MTGPLQRFRIAANIVGMLLVLLTISVVLRHGFGHPGMEKIVAPVHGFFFALVYLPLGYHLSRLAGWPLKRFLLVVLAGVVPLVTFIVERRVTRELRARM